MVNLEWKLSFSVTEKFWSGQLERKMSRKLWSLSCIYGKEVMGNVCSECQDCGDFTGHPRSIGIPIALSNKLK